MLLAALQLPTRATQADAVEVCFAAKGVLESVTNCEQEALEVAALDTEACLDEHGVLGRVDICNKEAREARDSQLEKCFADEGLLELIASCKEKDWDAALATCLDRDQFEVAQTCEAGASTAAVKKGEACHASRKVAEFTERCEQEVWEAFSLNRRTCFIAQAVLEAVEWCEREEKEAYLATEEMPEPVARCERPSWGPAFADAAAQGPDQADRTTYAAAPQTPHATRKDGPAHATSVLPFPWVGGHRMCWLSPRGVWNLSSLPTPRSPGCSYGTWSSTNQCCTSLPRPS